MIKGVNKTIIEINEFDSKMFEKAILFLKPNAKNFSEIGIKNEARKYLKTLEDSNETISIKRKQRRRRVIFNRFMLGSIVLSILLGIAGLIAYII